MDYREALDRLASLSRFGMKLTLDRIEGMLDLLGRPEKRLRAVHVAGTNGKGSTVAFLDTILRAAGYTTGRWTSPHLVSYRERLCLNGEPVSRDLMAEAFSRVWPTVERLKEGPSGHPTEFEAGTAMAFLVLAEASPNICLIEAGLGGLYDTTNVLAPEAAVITHLALDHADRLGPDLASIAAQKAGIIKPGRPVVIAAPQEGEALDVLLARAQAMGSPVTLVGRDFHYDLLAADAGGTYVAMRGAADYGKLRLNLLGAHQAGNAATAVAAAEVLNRLSYSIPPQAVGLGLDQAVWPGRLEVVRREPLVVLDGAHNPDGMASLARALREVFRQERVDFLLGILESKPVEEMVSLIAPLARRVVVTSVSGGTAPGAPVARVAAAFDGSGAVVECEPDPAAALASALAGVPGGGLLCVCGSLYMVGTIRGIISPTCA
ncbi:MAG: bifunctional folylpolyglutamate synthase/dihydrofolate synthase [Patescibacteria group bacterium]